jgi:hypothetical protein
LIGQNISAYFNEIEDLLVGQSQIKMHFSGSIAKLLAPELAQKILEMGQQPGLILAAPSFKLFDYHITI